jgi:integration host factor subunit beta
LRGDTEAAHRLAVSARVKLMTKADFTKEIARVLELPLKEAKTVLDVILDSMVRALRKGERVELRGFGSFSTHMRAARRGMNPRTGDRLNIPMKRVPGFKPSGELRGVDGTVGRFLTLSY